MATHASRNNAQTSSEESADVVVRTRGRWPRRCGRSSSPSSAAATTTARPEHRGLRRSGAADAAPGGPAPAARGATYGVFGSLWHAASSATATALAACCDAFARATGGGVGPATACIGVERVDTGEGLGSAPTRWLWGRTYHTVVRLQSSVSCVRLVARQPRVLQRKYMRSCFQPLTSLEPRWSHLRHQP